MIVDDNDNMTLYCRGGDKQMEVHVKEKLADVDRQLGQLQREEQSIEKNISSKTERRKLSVF